MRSWHNRFIHALLVKKVIDHVKTASRREIGVRSWIRHPPHRPFLPAVARDMSDAW